MLVIAHRGASARATENSIAAFRLAVEMGADGVELDVHTTSDGVMVVHHDAAIGGRPLAGMTASEVRAHQLPNGEAPPLLGEALAAIPEPMQVFVEVKGLAPEHDDDLFEVLDADSSPARLALHGFDHRIIRRLSSRRPDYRYGVLSVSIPVAPEQQARDAGATAVWQQRGLVDAHLITRLHDHGVSVYVWTVDDTTEMLALGSLGVDGICTNHPDSARRILTR